MILFFIAVFTALLVSGLCSLLEAILLSFTPSQVANLSSHHPKIGAIWQRFKTNIERPIAVILIVNTTAHTIGATIAGAQFELLYGNKYVFLFSLLLTFLMLQFTEILPKTLGVRYNRQLAPWIARPLSSGIVLLSPLLYLIRLINKPFEPKSESNSTIALEEITGLASQARLGRLIDPRQERIIHGATQLSDKNVEEIMIPAEQVTFLSTSQRINDAIITAHLDPHTRFPISEGDDPNHVLGYVNFKEIIFRARTNPADQSLRGIIRPVYLAKPDLSATALLKVFVERHEHMAIVRGNQQTLGIVTLEDVIEELVGELEDEFDRLPRMLHPLSGSTWMVGGGVPTSELAQRLNLRLDDPAGTTAAWLIDRLGNAPKPGAVVRENGVTFTVRRTRRGKVFEVAATVSKG